jgi:apolipoprotein N-acyltransferase
MPRIELMVSLIAGVSGGLAGLVWSRLVSNPWLARGTGAADPDGSFATQVAVGLAFAGAGAVLGLFYWLGWGLISMVGEPWYATGLVFGVGAWAGTVAPLAITLRLRRPDTGRAAAVLAVEWLVTCVAVGVTCALAWRRIA